MAFTSYNQIPPSSDSPPTVWDVFLSFRGTDTRDAAGHPLALQIFGTTLLNESEEGWRSFIDTLKRGPIDSVQKNLMSSFDALKSVPYLQDIFLDIACFYIGLEKTRVSRILETCYTYVNRNIDILYKICLITISKFGILGMHDLLRDMGKDIARNNSSDELGKHSRLWVSEDIDTVLKNHEGTEAIQGIISGYYYEYKMREVTYVAKTFKRMSKLKFLYLNNVNLTGSFRHIFKDLRWLRWMFFPLECLPSEFYAEKLVILELPHSNMRTWEATQDFKSLKTLNMSSSRNLETTPNFSRLPCLETLNLEDCSNLEEVHVSIGSLASLLHLNLGNCEKLKSLPDSICNLRALEYLTITGCTRLEALPTELGSIESLKVLNLSGLSVSKLPGLIGHLSNLVELDLSRNKNLETLPDNICNLRSLEFLDISECKQIKELPDQLGMITSLRELNVWKATMLRMLPDISQLSNLKNLDLIGSRHLLSISELPTNLERIEAIDCTSLKRLPDLSSLKDLKSLELINCEALKEIQGLEEVTSLEYLRLDNCRSLERLPNLCNLKHLKEFNLTHCDSLKEILSLEELTCLEDLPFERGNLLPVSKLPPNLVWIHAQGCRSLKGLPNLSNLKQLEELDIRGCSGLTEIQGLEELTSLGKLDMAGCSSSLLACTLTKRLFQILSGFGHKVEIVIGRKRRKEFQDWISQPSRLDLGIQLKFGSMMSLDLQPNTSHNVLAIILAFDDEQYSFNCSVKIIRSGFTWSKYIYNFGDSSLIVIVPSSILSISDGDDRIEITTDKCMLCGSHLLYKTENARIRENCSSMGNVDDERSDHLHSDLESSKKLLSLGSSRTTVDVGEERSYPSKRLKHSECDNN